MTHVTRTAARSLHAPYFLFFLVSVTAVSVTAAATVAAITLSTIKTVHGQAAPTTAISLTGSTASGAPPRQDHPCIGAAELAQARQKVADYFANLGGQPFGPTLTPYLVQPVAGQLYTDIFNTNFYDLDSTTGIQDWDCTMISYDGHDGTDIGLRSFAEQAVGVPVFASLPGTVIATHDGEVDDNTCGLACTTLANSVIIDHGNGRVGYYWHLRNGSVSVTPGATVAAGEQIGLVGSSGLSSGPHLHLGTEVNGTFVEPYVGPCNAGTTLWSDQPEIERAFYLFDHGMTPLDLTSHPGLPQSFPRSGEYAVTDGPLTLWILAANMPANPPFTLRVRRPNGTVAGIFTGALNTVPQLFSWHWIQFNVPPEMHTLTGNWRIQLLFGATLWVDSFVEVVNAHGPIYNDAPEPIGVHFEPAVVQKTGPLSCHVDTDVLNDDRDFDIVRYNYVWIVDGLIVRDVTHGGLVDILAQGQLTGASAVTCTVTPWDDVIAGPPSSVTYPFGVTFIRGDCNADGSFNLPDPIYALSVLFNSGNPPTCDDACDANDDGAFNLVDAIAALNAIFGLTPALPAPALCGVDPTDTDALDCVLAPGCP